MQDTVARVVGASTSIGAIEVVQNIPVDGEMLKLIIQLAIGVVTLFSMLRKRKNGQV